MSIAHNFLTMISAMAGPAGLAVYLIKNKPDTVRLRTSTDIMGALDEAILLQPSRWFHTPAALLTLSMPIFQWFGYLRWGSIWAVLLPLAAVGVLQIFMGVCAPRAIFREKPNYMKDAIRVTSIVFVLLATMLLPSTGMVTVFRGVLIDLLGLLAVGVLVRRLQIKSIRIDAPPAA